MELLEKLGHYAKEYVKSKIPYGVGVYVPSGDLWRSLVSVKPARPMAEMLLMMFRSAARDRR